MKNRYITLSVVAGLSLYSLPQLVAAQMLTHAHTLARRTVQPAVVQVNDVPPTRMRPLKKVLADLEKRFAVNFAYDDQLVEGRVADGAAITTGTLEQNLANLLAGQGMRFRKIKTNLYVIQAAAEPKAAPVSPLANAATTRPDVVAGTTEALVKRLTGRILDENNQGLPGANIIEKGTNNGATTDAEGNFQLNVSDEATTLTVSSVGYTRQEVAINGQSTFTIKLIPDDRTLNEVVVIGYQTVRKQDLTGATDVISPIQSNKVTANSLGESIQGLSPGVTVRNTGLPGQGSSVQIRGVASFLNTDPLYVIDGMIADANPTINTNDIETIQVLKDASAAAIYGSRAANGVIIITTRQGKEGPVRVSFSAKYGAQTLPRRWDVMESREFAALQRQQYTNAGQPIPASVVGDPTINTNWQDQVLQTGNMQDYNLALSGGNATSSYLVSGSYFGNKGYVQGTGFDRISARINTRSQFGRVTIGENIVLTNSNIQNPPTFINPIYDMAKMLPVIPVQDARYVSATNPGGFGIGTVPDAISYSFNPVAARTLATSKSNFAKIVGNAFVDVKILEGLTYRFNAGLEASFDYTQNLRKVGVYQYSAAPVPSSVGESRSRFTSTLFEHTLNFNRTFGSVHSLNGVIGISQQNTRRDVTSASRTDLGFSGGQYFETIDAATGTSNTAGGTPDKFGILGYIGRLNYTYNDKYLLTLTGRIDQDSRFGTNYRTGFFPSVAAAWRISKEDFFQADWISDLKLSASYGRLGIVVPNLGSFPYTAFINNNPRAIFGIDQNPNVGAYQAQLANPDLRWETRVQQNVGVTASFLNNRISTEINLYNSLSTDALLNLPVPGYLGNLRGNPFVNSASIRNQGIEFSLTYRNNSGPVKWDVSGNFTTIKNRVESVGNQGFGVDFIQTGLTRSQVGSPVGQWFLVKSNGIFQNQAEIDAYVGADGRKIQPNARPGDIRYVDRISIDSNNDGIPDRGDGVINIEDRQYVSSPWPTLQAGAQANLSYAGLSLNVQLVGVFGYTLFNDVRTTLDGYQNTNFRRDVSPWSPTNTNTNDPRIGLEQNDPGIQSNNLRFTDRWLENASYVRVRNIELGYTLPTNLLKQARVRNARVFVSGQNLLTFTKYTGLDPDVTGASIQERGLDNGHYPAPRVVSVGITGDF